MDVKIADRIVALMNEALALSPEAITSLVGYRVPCAPALYDHPSIQVGPPLDNSDKGPVLGLLGLLNGICKSSGSEVIAAVVEPDGRVSGFKRLGGPEARNIER